MAHPDEGYAIPDDEWSGDYDPETGQNYYPDDPHAHYRYLLELIEAERKRGKARPDLEEEVMKYREQRRNG